MSLQKKPISFVSRKVACSRGGVILVMEQDSGRAKILEQPGAVDGGVFEITHLNRENRLILDTSCYPYYFIHSLLVLVFGEWGKSNKAS